jgi:ABC-type lipoprotein export system ATPase subunit
VLGYSISKLTPKESAELRNKSIGFIFQTYNLLPVYTVYENVEFALLLQKIPADVRHKAVMIDFIHSQLAKSEYENCRFGDCNFSDTDISGYIFCDCEFICRINAIDKF